MRHRQMTTAGLVLAGTMMGVYGLAAFTSGVAEAFTCFFFGLYHAPLGLAQLNLDKNGNLVVSNIGSSGEDGVAVNFGPADGVEVHFLGALAGSFLQIAAAGEVNGLPDQDLGHVRMPTLPEGYVSIDPDFSPIGVDDYTIEVYLAGELVHTQVQAGPAATVPQLPHGLSVFHNRGQGGAARGANVPSVDWDLHFPIATSIHIVNGPTVLGDLLRLVAVPPTPWIVGFIDGIYITAADSGQLTLTIGGERLLQFSNPHSALGQAHMIGFDPAHLPRQLIVSNIGSSGADGVSIDLTEFPPEPVIPSAAVHLLIPDVFAAGAYVEAAASVMGIEPSPFLLGSSRATNVLNDVLHVEVTADFLPIGANTYTVELYNKGRLVAVEMGVIDPVVLNNANLNVSIFNHIAARARGKFEWGLTSVQMVMIPGGPTVPANEIRLIAEVPGGVARGPVPSLVSMDLTAAGIGSFTITDEVEEISFSTADISGPLGAGFPDGCVDAFDLAVVLGAWCSAAGDPDPPGDIDPPCEDCASPIFALADISGAAGVADGCVDAFDLGKLLANWCSVAGGNPCGTCFP